MIKRKRAPNIKSKKKTKDHEEKISRQDKKHDPFPIETEPVKTPFYKKLPRSILQSKQIGGYVNQKMNRPG